MASIFSAIKNKFFDLFNYEEPKKICDPKASNFLKKIFKRLF